MQSQEASNPDVRRSSLHLVDAAPEPLDASAAPIIDAPPRAAAALFDQLLADHRAVAIAFDLIERELGQPSPDREACCLLLTKIDAILGTHAYAKRHLMDSVFVGRRDDLDDLISQLEALLEVDRAWSAKVRVLMDRVERQLFDDAVAA